MPVFLTFCVSVAALICGEKGLAHPAVVSAVIGMGVGYSACWFNYEQMNKD